MRRLPKLVFVGLILSSPLQADILDCFLTLGRLEQKIARELGREKFSESYRNKTTLSQIREQTQLTPGVLRIRNIDFETLTEQEVRKHGLMLASAMLVRQKRLIVEGAEGIELEKEGQFHRIRSVRKDLFWHGSPMGDALSHKEIDRIVERMESLGVDLFVDSTMALTVFRGYHQEGLPTQRPRIVIGMQTPYHVLIHELEHAEFEKHQVKEFVFVAERYLHSDETLAVMKKKSPWANYGEEKLDRIIALLRSGVPAHAVGINEAMAIDAQIRAMGQQPHTKIWTADKIAEAVRHSENYRTRHYLDALVQHILFRKRLDNGAGQGRLLLDCLEKLGVLNSDHYKNTDLPKLVATYRQKMDQPDSLGGLKKAAAVGAGAAAILGIVFHQDLAQFVMYLGNGDQITIGPSDDDTAKKKKKK